LELEVAGCLLVSQGDFPAVCWSLASCAGSELAKGSFSALTVNWDSGGMSLVKCRSH